MNNIKLLDCTLRDGGYINNWEFGEHKIRRISQKLVQSRVDIIELGFLRGDAESLEQTLFCNADEILERCGIVKSAYFQTVAMFDDRGSFDARKLPERSGKTVDGIRFIFKPGDLEKVKEAMQIAKSLGFLVYINPMLTAHYENRALLELVDDANEIGVEAVSIVDTFGSMHNDTLLYLFRLLQHNLDKKIAIGYHSHNNLQLAFSNALELINLHSKREIILDSSCFGMGRGGGNLPTELIMRHLNDTGARYNLTPILDIIDSDLLPIYRDTPWGYSAAHFLSASMDLHPNYATYLMNASRLTIPIILEILSQIAPEKRAGYDEKYIAQLYFEHQAANYAKNNSVDLLKPEFEGKPVLLVAPGRTVITERGKINDYISKKSPVVITVNIAIETVAADYIFVGNQRRFNDLISSPVDCKLLVTSNVSTENADIPIDIIDFSEVAALDELVEIDNSGIMALRLMKNLHVSEVVLAGFDGFNMSHNDYIDDKLEYYSELETIALRNAAITRQIAELRESVNLRFITTTIYE